MNSNFNAYSRASLALSTAMLLASVWVASTAFADDQVRRETVKFQDLNVNTDSGLEALYRRIHSAAKRVCSETDRMQQARASACAKKAEAQVIETLNLPLLTDYYRMKTGGSAVLSASR